jgi:hypothetical protein
MSGFVRLRPSKTRALLLLAGSAAFTAGGVLMISGAKGFTAWFVTLFFGACGLIALVHLLPRASYLELQPEGFIVRSLYRQWPLIRWSQVSEFGIARFSWGNRMVVFNDSQPVPPRLAKANVALFGFTSALPDTYGMKPDALADLLNRRRLEALPPAQAGRS